MKTIAEFIHWREGAIEEFGDPTIPVGQAFFQYVPALADYHEGLLAASTGGRDSLILMMGLDAGVRVRVSEAGPEGDAGGLLVFGLEEITPGLWTLFPSANLPGLAHLFVVIYGVPVPAPWGKRIIIVG
jgi:hypothetical protein